MVNQFFKRIVSFFNDLDSEEKAMIFGSVGILIISISLLTVWRARVDQFQNQEPPQIIEEEEEQEPPQIVEEEEEEYVFENPILGYKIVGFPEIERVDEAFLLGKEYYSPFVIEIGEITHALFENRDELSTSEWIEERAREQAQNQSDSIEEVKDSLNIAVIRERSTSLGEGKEIVRVNQSYTSETLIPMENFILSFYYMEDSQVSAETISRRRNLIENIIESIE